MKKYKQSAILVLVISLGLSACNKFLDVVPDNVATLDNAFTTRIQAQKFLYTCYSYMPAHGSVDADPAMLGGDEIWRYAKWKGFMEMARGFQNTVNPIGDQWGFYFRAIHDCNIFLENINKVPDLEETERRRWISEVKFLKAYYHFYLIKMYGPIPVMKENLPIDAAGTEINVYREPVDSGFHYIIQLIDESIAGLPPVIDNPVTELGRITQPIALSLKAKVLVYAASPLFNGNTDVATLKNRDGMPLFDAAYSEVRWDSAAVACKKAIDMCEQAGMRLYEYTPNISQVNLSDAIKTQLGIRNSVCERWNSEIIWANTQTNSTSLQRLITPFLDPNYLNNLTTHGDLSPPLKMAELFYSKNGVPINEDTDWQYDKRNSLRTAQAGEALLIKSGYVTAGLNFDRESRFYADLGFDGGVWYGQGKYDDSAPSSLLYLQAKFRERDGGYGKTDFGTVTGYYIKKLVHFQNVIDATTYSVTPYPFTIMRLADLYLLYAEALNESLEQPTDEVYKYVDLVRQRAGLKSVKYSWDHYSSNPSKYTTKEGMREIIRQERLIELAFEGQRFWDLRRWKEAADELNKPVMGWDLMQESANAYYRPVVIYDQTFGMKDYFWPIAETTLSKNQNLVQNLGW